MLSFFPLDVLDEIWDVSESVSEGFLTYSSLMQTDYRLILCKTISFKNGLESPLLVCFVYILTTDVSERKQCKILFSRIKSMPENF